MTDERDDEPIGEDEARAVRALDRAERADPPPGLAGAIMQAVRARGAAGRRFPAGWRVSTSKKVLLGVAAAATIAIGYFAIKGYPPVDSGAQGTIGAARKHQSEQIPAKDVVLEDAELQAFMQSDVFQKLIRDRAVRQALASQAVRQALASQEVQQALANPAFQQALASPAFQRALATQAFHKALASQAFQASLARMETEK